MCYYCVSQITPFRRSRTNSAAFMSYHIYAGDGDYNGHAGGRYTADNVGYMILALSSFMVPVGTSKEPG